MTCYEAAQDYLSRGWSCIPLKPRGKAPQGSWTGWMVSHPSPNHLQAWFDGTDANIGIVTGQISGLVVADLDGADLHEWLVRYPSGLVAATGGGGYHVYYLHPGGSVPNRVGLEPGVDIRGDGGMVVAPPSVHISGRSYKWISEGLPAPLPPDMLEVPEEVFHGGASSEKWLTLLMAGVSEGGRDDAATRLAGYWASKEIPKDVAASILRDWNRKNKPPLPDAQLLKCLDSVWRKEAGQVRKVSIPTKVAKTRDPQNKGVFDLMSLEEYGARYGGSGVTWCVDEWLPDQTVGFVVAPPGTYKTWVTFDLAVSVASGMPFLGKYKVNNPGPVLLIQQEDHHGQTVERLGTIVWAKQQMSLAQGLEIDLPDKLPFFVHADRALRLSDNLVMQAFADQIAAVQPRLVIIDPMYSIGSVEDYFASDAERLMILKKLRDEFGCSFMIVHHTGKGDKPGRERIWGSQFLNALLETGWQFAKVEDDDRCAKVSRHFKSSGPKEPLYLSFNIETAIPPWTYDVDVDTELEEVDPDDDDSPEAYVTAHPDCTAAEVCAACGCSKATAYRVIKKLKQTSMDF